jgi:hypothetical protein
MGALMRKGLTSGPSERKRDAIFRPFRDLTGSVLFSMAPARSKKKAKSGSKAKSKKAAAPKKKVLKTSAKKAKAVKARPAKKKVVAKQAAPKKKVAAPAKKKAPAAAAPKLPAQVQRALKLATAEGLISRLPPPVQPVVTLLRKVVLEVAPEASEQIENGAAAYFANGVFARIEPTEHEVLVRFLKGGKLPSASELPGEGDSRALSFKTVAELRENVLRKVVREAVMLNMSTSAAEAAPRG